MVERTCKSSKSKSGCDAPNWQGGKVNLKCKNCKKIFPAWLYEKEKGKRYCSLKCSNNSDENKKRLKKLVKNRNWLGKNHPMYGKKHSLKTCKKISKACKGKFVGKLHPRWKGGYENVLMLNRKRRLLKRGISAPAYTRFNNFYINCL